MPIDSSIAMGVRPIQVESPLNALAQVLQAKGLQNQNELAQYTLGKAKRGDEDMNALMVHLQGGGDLSTPEGQAAAMRVAPLSAPALIKSNLDQLKLRSDITKNTSDAQAKDVEAAGKRLELVGQTLNFVRQNPTLENAKAALDHLVQNGGMPADRAAAALAKFQADPTPQGINNFATLAYQASLKAKDQLPTFQTRNTGGTTDTLSINPVTGAVAVANTVKNTQSPDNAASVGATYATLAETKRHHGVEERTAADAKEQGKWQYDADRGGLVNLQSGEFKPATQAGAPIGAKDKNLTEGQAKANVFGTRMQEADKVLSKMAKDGVLRPGVIKSVAESVGNIAGLGTESMGGALSDAAGSATNWTQSAEQQQVEQAQRDFLNATLRRESGASISPAEFRNGNKQYFPQPGDDPATLDQKTRNRQLATQGILAEVPENKRTKPPVAPEGAWDAGKESRYQEWKARQGK